jgi:DNA polymerase (family 10)
MTNKEIAYAFDELASLMELHGEDDFRIKSYKNAYLTIRKLDAQLADMTEDEMKSIKGIGNAISGKIRELTEYGKMANLEKFREKTPAGVRELLEINGFGPKKVRQVWQEMGIESIGELWYACNENRLVEYKGFGLKTQQELLKNLDYYQKSKGKLHLDAAEEIVDAIGARITAVLRGAYVSPVGELRRKCPVISLPEILVGYNGELGAVFDDTLTPVSETASMITVMLNGETKAVIHHCKAEEFGSKLFLLTGSDSFVRGFTNENAGKEFRGLRTEFDVFEKAHSAYVVPELRESYPVHQFLGERLVEQHDLTGILHIHTTYSDGLHSLRQMCERARDLGYDYIGITDHSQSAFYANGLKPDRLKQQWDEIDLLNEEMVDFRILKGIESDILNDGSLDYPDDILDNFDFIIASVHSNLKMTIEKATERVVRAIEHPKTTILGHPTGRLLLSREGYPLEWDAVFEACARNNVAIELNAHPYRLDIDYTLIPEAVRHGIKISVNPDAHSLSGMDVVKYGLSIARKGGLSPEYCFNAQPLNKLL